MPVTSRRILAAFEAVPRSCFVSDTYLRYANDDAALPIGHGQTISQPYMAAVMLDAMALTGDERVLEVGVGSGYVVALLLQLAGEVFGIERVAPLLERARASLCRAGVYDRATADGRLHLRTGDGSVGWPEAAPFEAIVVSAGAPRLPRALLDQLAPGGRLVVPVGDSRNTMRLAIAVRPAGSEGETGWRPRVTYGVQCAFVPLIGREGFDPEPGDEPTGEDASVDVNVDANGTGYREEPQA